MVLQLYQVADGDSYHIGVDLLVVVIGNLSKFDFAVSEYFSGLVVAVVGDLIYYAID